MLWSGTLLKGGLNIPQFPIGPRCHGRVGQKMSCKFFPISTYDYIRNTCLHYIDELSQFDVTICYRCYMRNCIRHNYPSLIHCLRAFHILIFAMLLSVATATIATKLLLLLLPPLLLLPYYFATKYFLQILSLSCVVELTTQLLILEYCLAPLVLNQ